MLYKNASLHYAFVSLTENGNARTSRLTSAAIYIEIRMPTRIPLTQNARTRMDYVHEVCVRLVQITGVIGAGIKKYRRIQSGDATEFALVDAQVICHQTSNVSTHTVANEVHVVGLHAARMSSQILDQLGNAQAAESRRPLHLAEARLLNQATVVDDDDVVVTAPEVRLTYVGTGIVVAAAPKAVDHDFCRMRPIEVRIVQRFGVQNVQQFGFLLGATRVQVELNAGMRTSVGFLDAWLRCEGVTDGRFSGGGGGGDRWLDI